MAVKGSQRKEKPQTHPGPQPLGHFPLLHLGRVRCMSVCVRTHVRVWCGVFICACSYVCMRVGWGIIVRFGPWRTSLGLSTHIPPCLKQDLLVFFTLHARLAGLWASLSASQHLPRGCWERSHALLWWALDIQIQVLTRVRQTLYPDLFFFFVTFLFLHHKE